MAFLMWFYKGFEFVDPGKYQGFVYEITNLTNGCKYIGKKNFYSTKKLPPLKGKVNKRHKTIETDWQDYYSSSTIVNHLVNTLGKDYFRRDIIKLCMNKTMMSYWECKLQFERNVLTSDVYYNEFIGCRINRKGLRDE